MNSFRERKITSGFHLQSINSQACYWNTGSKNKEKEIENIKKASGFMIDRLQETINYEYLADIDDFNGGSSNDEGFGSTIDSSGRSDNILGSSIPPKMLEDDEENKKALAANQIKYKIQKCNDEDVMAGGNASEMWKYEEDLLDLDVGINLYVMYFVAFICTVK